MGDEFISQNPRLDRLMILFDHARERVCPETENCLATVIMLQGSVFFFPSERFCPEL